MAAATKKSHGEYDATNITVLKGLEAVRKRPGMYIGSTGERGLHHLVWEVVDNSVDESMAGYATAIGVRLLEDGGVEVSDDGRGIPVEMHDSGRPTVDVVLTELHAGGKFDHGAYKVAGGLHGVGLSVVNALSTRVEVDISRDGYTWRQSYDHTVPGTLKQGGATKNTGTVVRFWADPTIFETTEYNFETVSDRLQQMAFLNKGLTITLTDERVDTADAEAKAATRRTFHYPLGLVDYIKHINGTKAPIHNSIIHLSGNATGHHDEVEVEVAMQWNASYSESVHTFANTINTGEGGTHEEGFRSALTTVVNRYARDQKLLKGKVANLTGEDIRGGLAAVISVKVGEPQFEGQTKTKLVNTAVRSIVQKVCNEQLAHVVRREPGRCQNGGQEGGVVRAGPDGRARDSWTGCAARAQQIWAGCPESSRTADQPTRPGRNYMWWKVIRPAAPPRAAATRSSRRSCRSAERSSTSRRPASTAH